MSKNHQKVSQMYKLLDATNFVNWI